MTRRELAGLAVLGIGGLTLVQLLRFVAISMLPWAVALLLEYPAVILVALTARLWLGEHLPKLQVAEATISLASRT